MAIVPQLQSISIHAPRTGSDSSILPPTAWTADFNPRSPHGERQQRRRRAVRTCAFQSTLPARGATYVGNHSAAYSAFQSTLPARGATLRWTVKNTRLENFNPRSPHGERRVSMHTSRRRRKFQSTLPARGATRRCSCCGRMALFQSTLPARGATRRVRLPCAGRAYFNPRSPHGERRKRRQPTRTATSISIHAPRTGSDRGAAGCGSRRRKFQSTLPARGATLDKCVPTRASRFQSTLPARGATFSFCREPGLI